MAISALKVGQILHEGFGAEVLVYDPYKSAEDIHKAKGKKSIFAGIIVRSGCHPHFTAIFQMKKPADAF